MRRAFVLFTLLLPLVVFGQQGSWTETSRNDFSDGWYERDIYCSYRAVSYEPDSGALEFVPRFDFTNDGWIDVVVSNKPNSAGWDQAKQDWILLYTGGADGYNSQRFLSYLTNNGATVDGADLDLDGYNDLVVCHYYSPSMAKVGALCIYWGTAAGPSPTDTTMLPQKQQTESVYIADVNKDGWLDIIGSDYGARLDTTFGANADSIAIFWGGPNRAYSSSKATFLPASVARHNFQVADFDKDNFYDIFVVNYYGTQNYIYWGSKDGFNSTNLTRIDYQDTFPHGVTTADFNRDGWLDFVITGNYTINESYVYYGNPANPRVYNNPTKLNTGPVFGGCASFDYNSDEWLDVIMYRGQANQTTTFHEKPWIYLGSETGFSDSNRLEIGARKYNMSGGFLTDFNKDGIVDLFVHSWDLFDSSGVLWGPDFYTHTQLFCNTDHHSQCRDMGHVYTREQREPYISNVFDAGQAVNWDAFITIDSTPGTSNINFRVRTGPTPTPDASWTDWFQARSNGSIPDSVNGKLAINRYFQYDAGLQWSYLADLPVLFEVTTYWGPSITLEPDYDSTTYPAVEITYPMTVTNDGTVSDVIDVTTEGTLPGWTLTLYTSTGDGMEDSNSDGIPDVDSVSGSGGQSVFRVGLTPPSDAMVGDVDTTIVWVHSTNNETVRDSAVLITHVEPMPALLLLPNQDSSAYRGQTVRYALTLTNSGNGPDVVDITTEGTLAGWNVDRLSGISAPLTDSDADGVPDLGSVPGGGGIAGLLVDVTIPFTATEGERDTTWVVAHSSVDTATTSRARLVTTVLVPPDTVPVVALRIDPDTLVETEPETPVMCTLRVQNLGNKIDTFDIEVGFITANVWNYRLLEISLVPLGDLNSNSVPDVGALVPGSGKEFLFEVTPPAGVGNDFTGTSALGNTAIAVLTARSSVRDTVTERSEDTILVIPLFNVHNFPNPFTGPTTFYFSLPEPGKVTLKIYNRAGEYLATVVENKPYDNPGVYFEPWDGLTSEGRRPAPGVMLYHFNFVPDNEAHRARNVVKKALSKGGSQ